MKNKLLNIEAAFDIRAVKAEEGKPDGLPTFTMKAYDGDKMDVDGWGLVVIDVAGLKASDSTPILYGHDRRSLDSVLGMTDRVVLDNAVTASGTIMATEGTADRVVSLARNGYKFQASVGVEPKSTKDIDEGETVEVNGRVIEGPFTLVQAGTLREISIVPLGADSDTETAIAAEQAQNAHKQEGNKMSDQKPREKTAEDIRAEAVAEQTRIALVQAAAKDWPDIAKQAVEAGWDESRAKLAVLEAHNAKLEAKIKADEEAAQRPTGIHINAGAPPKADARTLEAAVAIRAGMKQPERRYDADTLNAASDMRIHSITDLVAASMALEGKRLDCSRHDTKGFLQAAFSTRNIANVLSNLANKFILEGYGTVEQTWRLISSIRAVVDFKANTGVRLVMDNLLKDLGPGGEIEHGTLSDETRSVQADTKALMLGVTRKDIINDDLGALTELPTRLGYAAARTFNTSFWAAFTAAIGANFEQGGTKKNETTGALTLTTLAAAEKLFLEQTDADGNPIGGELTTLLTGTTAYTPAREIFVSTKVTNGSTTKGPDGNIYVNRFAPAYSRYIAAAPWYLVANPMAMPLMQVAFLNGRQEPFVETADADFNTLGVQMRCYYDYGASFCEYRAAVRSTGV
jgi:hypothetical protein